MGLNFKQGDPLSPILSMFFINDIVDCINNVEILDTVDIEKMTLFILLYANDAVIFAKSAESLQIVAVLLYIVHKFATIYPATYCRKPDVIT